MARSRMIKPEFWTSETLARVSRGSRLTFIGIWNHCDDYGVILKSPRRLLGDIYPIDESVSETDIKQEIQELLNSGLLIECNYEGKTYLIIRSWFEHQKVDKPNKRHFIPVELVKKIIKTNTPPKKQPEKENEKKENQEKHVFFAHSRESREGLARVSRGIHESLAVEREIEREIETETETETETEREKYRNSDELLLQKNLELSETNNSKISNSDFQKAFEHIWGGYPRKEGRKQAFKHFKASVKSPEEFQEIQKALQNYRAKIEVEEVAPQFVKMGSSWFNNWRDYVDYVPIEKTDNSGASKTKKAGQKFLEKMKSRGDIS